MFQMLFTAMAIYAPSLALSAVTPLKLDVTIIATSLVCTIYTTVVSLADFLVELLIHAD